MFQVNCCKLNKALFTLLLVILLIEHTEPSFNAMATKQDLDNRISEIIKIGNIGFDEGQDLLGVYQKIFNNESPEQRLEILQSSYKRLKGGSIRGYVSNVIIDFLFNATKVSNDTKKLTKLVDQAYNMIETEKEKAFPRQPNFIQRFFGATANRGPYDNYGLGATNLFGYAPSQDTTQKVNENSGNSQTGQTESQSKSGGSSVGDAISGLVDLFSGKKKLTADPKPQQASSNPSQGDSTKNSAVIMTTTTPAPEKSGFKFQDILGWLG